MRNIALPLALLATMLVAPASAQNVETRSLNTLNSAPKKFVLIKAYGQDPVELERYARLVRDQLNAKDWKEAAFVAADVAVFVDYRIAALRTEVSRTKAPASDAIGPGTSGRPTTGLTTVGLQSDNAEPEVTTAYAMPPEVTHERSVRIEMFAAKPYVRNMNLVPVYDMTVRSSGGAGSLDSAMPELVKAALAPIAERPSKTKRGPSGLGRCGAQKRNGLMAKSARFKSGAPGRIRTHDPLVRRLS